MWRLGPGPRWSSEQSLRNCKRQSSAARDRAHDITICLIGLDQASERTTYGM